MRWTTRNPHIGSRREKSRKRTNLTTRTGDSKHAEYRSCLSCSEKSLLLLLKNRRNLTVSGRKEKKKKSGESEESVKREDALTKEIALAHNARRLRAFVSGLVGKSNRTRTSETHWKRTPLYS
jgi:hypothetical protein